MNSEEIKAEAKRRLATMSEQEKKALFNFTDEENAFLDYIERVGVSKLNKDELNKFRVLAVQMG